MQEILVLFASASRKGSCESVHRRRHTITIASRSKFRLLDLLNTAAWSFIRGICTYTISTKWSLKKNTKNGFRYRLSFTIKLTVAIKTLVLSIFKWPLKTGFTVLKSQTLAQIHFGLSTFY